MTRVKICGITNLEDARTAVDAGGDFLGFIFYPPSARYVAPEQVRDILAALQPACAGVHTVGVFVDEATDRVAQIASTCGLDYVQLHGAEPPEAVAALLAQELGVIKALRVRDADTLAEMGTYRATAILLDTYVPGTPGGTGHTFDWALAAQTRAHGPIILAGGLTPDNVAEAVRVAQPWGVDVSSGVEAAPGRKDADKVRRFVAEAKR